MTVFWDSKSVHVEIIMTKGTTVNTFLAKHIKSQIGTSYYDKFTRIALKDVLRQHST